jgi:site-specific DNA-cytosine methylase
MNHFQVLVACEESQIVTAALRAVGVEAYSCDLVPTTGAHPEWHMQRDVNELLDVAWDAIIAFPPCTHLAVSGARWFAEKRAAGLQQEAAAFFMAFAECRAPRVAIENPVGVMSTQYRKPDQVIQPYQFGHTETKATCLWLRNLPRLRPTLNLREQTMSLPVAERARIHYMPPTAERAALRSKTYAGIARAMAAQWGALLLERSLP